MLWAPCSPNYVTQLNIYCRHHVLNLMSLTKLCMSCHIRQHYVTSCTTYNYLCQITQHCSPYSLLHSVTHDAPDSLCFVVTQLSMSHPCNVTLCVTLCNTSIYDTSCNTTLRNMFYVSCHIFCNMLFMSRYVTPLSVSRHLRQLCVSSQRNPLSCHVTQLSMSCHVM